MANDGHMPWFGTIFFESGIDCVCEKNIKSCKSSNVLENDPTCEEIIPFYGLASSETSSIIFKYDNMDYTSSFKTC